MKVLRVPLVASLLATAVAQTAADPDLARLQESLKRRYANGVVAVVENTVITAQEVMREMKPLLAQLRQHSRNDEEFRQRLDELAASATQDLIERADLIRQFRQDPNRKIGDKSVDEAVADEIAQRFNGDRTAFLTYLRTEGQTIRDFRREKEEELIYAYMRAQPRNGAPAATPAKAVPAPAIDPAPPQIHLRIIQLTRVGNEADGTLQARADAVLARLKAGARFDALAKEYSDTANAKGGDWGWIKPDALKEGFRETAFSLKPGEASVPILLPEGAFILFVEDRK